MERRGYKEVGGGEERWGRNKLYGENEMRVYCREEDRRGQEEAERGDEMWGEVSGERRWWERFESGMQRYSGPTVPTAGPRFGMYHGFWAMIMVHFRYL